LPVLFLGPARAKVRCLMQLEYIFLARYAELAPDGLFTVVGGGVDRINAGGFPWSWGYLFLVAQVRLPIQEAQREHRTAVERETPAGQIEPIGAESPMTPVPPTVEVGIDGNVRFSFNLSLVNLIFPEAGVYKYRLKIDGREIGTAELLVAGPTKGEQGQ
jgi:hypothetical protein